MKTCKEWMIVVFLIFVMAASAYGAGLMQFFAPNGKKAQNLSKASTTVDMRLDSAWSVFSNSTTCKFRSMSTATKKGLKRSLPANTRFPLSVNTKTPFINFTGCNGELDRQ